MGQLRQFKCGSCGYEAEVSGGPDCGMIAQTVTVACEECKSLQDAVVILMDGRSGEHKRKPLRCGRSAKHRVRLWTEAGECPKCGTPMETGEVTCLWD